MLRRNVLVAISALSVLAILTTALFYWWPREQTRSLSPLLLTKGELPISIFEYTQGSLSPSEGIGASQIGDVEKLEFRPDVCRSRKLDWMEYTESRSIYGDRFTGLLYPETSVTVTLLEGVGDQSNALLKESVSGECSNVVYVNRESREPQYQTVSATILNPPEWSHRFPSSTFFETVESNWSPVLRDAGSPGRISLYARVTVNSIAVHLFAVRDDRSRSADGFGEVTIRQLLDLLEAQVAKVKSVSS